MGYLKNLLGVNEADIGKEAEQETTHALTWMNPDRSGTAPAARNGHTANLIESRIFIFGGGDKSDLYGDLHVFDVRDHSWSQPPCTGVAPPMRSRHTSAVVDRNLYIWGGIGGGIDVHVLDTVSMDWSTPIVAGVVPDSRFGHTCVTVDATHAPRLFILGGHNSRQALSDLHVLEVGEQLTWTHPPVLGEPPILGNRHATVLIDDAAEAPLLACLLVCLCLMSPSRENAPFFAPMAAAPRLGRTPHPDRPPGSLLTLLPSLCPTMLAGLRSGRSRHIRHAVRAALPRRRERQHPALGAAADERQATALSRASLARGPRHVRVHADGHCGWQAALDGCDAQHAHLLLVDAHSRRHLAACAHGRHGDARGHRSLHLRRL